MILVTGGTGLVGSHLLFELVQKNYSVRAIKRKRSDINHLKNIFALYSSESEALFQRIEWVEIDLLNPAQLETAFDNIEYVYHVAAMVSFEPGDKETMLTTNIESTANIVDMCLLKDVKKLCHVSSVASLGEPMNGGLIHEDTLWKNSKGRSTYSLSKYKSEMEVWRGIIEGLNAVIVNPSVILGPGFWTKGSSALISTVAEGLRFFPNGGTGFVDVRDVVNAMVLLMESETSDGRYILNGGNYRYKEIFDMIATCMDVPKPSIRVNALMSSIGWRLEWLRSKLTGTAPKLTRETAEASKNTKAYSTQKIESALAFEFHSIEDTIKYLCNLYKTSAQT